MQMKKKFLGERQKNAEFLSEKRGCLETRGGKLQGSFKADKNIS